MYSWIRSIFSWMVLVWMAAGPALCEERATDSSLANQPDSSAPVELPGITVRSQRIPAIASEVPAAVETIELSELRRTGYLPISTAVNSVAGLRSYTVGNTWGNTVVDVRGFYGGGQAQYMYVTLNGIPLNKVSSGLVDWSGINLVHTQRVEVTKGTVAPQYGDFGFDGHLALYTGFDPDLPPYSLSLVTGSNEAYGASLSVNRSIASIEYLAAGSLRESDGWRQHSRLENRCVLASVSNGPEGSSRVNLLLGYADTDEELPGAITQAALDSNRNAPAVDALGRPIRDRSQTRRMLSGISASTLLSADLILTPKVYFNWTAAERIVTVGTALEHDPEEISAGFEASVQTGRMLLGRPWRLSVGTAVDYGSLQTAYRSTTQPDSSLLLSGGEGRRWLLSSFLTSAYEVTEPFTLTVSIRFDDLRSSFDYDESATADSAVELSQHEFCVSPSLAVNYVISPQLASYASVSGAFKAPTLVHLYDSPPVFNPFTGSYVLISSNELAALRGTSFETGIKLNGYHGWSARLSGYYYAVRKEIDFDNATLSYANIGKSRHVGLEISLMRLIGSRLSGELSLAYSSSTFREGDYKGNQINGIPKFDYGFTVEYRFQGAGLLNLSGNGVARQYTDQENQHRLEDYLKLHLRAAYEISPILVTLQIDNLTDRRFSYDGYFDPFVGETRFVPAAPRTASLSVNASF